MGNDGGTIAKGQDLRAVYSTELADPVVLYDNEKEAFNTCALSSLALFHDGVAQKVVSDYKGKLYLKEKMLEHLLAKKMGQNSKLTHVTGLGDLIDLNIKWSDDACVVCPVTGASTSNHLSLAYLRPCGCVFGYKVLTEVRKHLKIGDGVEESVVSLCPVCGKEFTFNYDVVRLNPQKDEEDFNERNYKFLQRKGMSHSKKIKKKKKKTTTTKTTKNLKDVLTRDGEKATQAKVIKKQTSNYR